MMIKPQAELCVLFSRSLGVMSLLAGGLVATLGTLQDVFSALYEIGPHQSFGDI